MFVLIIGKSEINLMNLSEINLSVAPLGVGKAKPLNKERNDLRTVFRLEILVEFGGGEKQ